MVKHREHRDVEKWERNIWTGHDILRVSKNERIIREGHGGSYLYNAEFWGDHSLDYPIKGGWRNTLAQARRDLVKLKQR